MTVNNDTIQNSIRQLETLLFHNDIFKETESHPLFILHDQLQEMDRKSQSTTNDEKQKVISMLNSFEINCLVQFIEQYASNIPSSILTALFDTIRFQINISMELNPTITDHYFDLSMTYLTADSTIDYLNGKKEIHTKIDEYFLNLFSSIGSCSVHIKTNISYSICVSHKNTPEFFQLNPPTELLLQAFIIYLNKFFLNNCQQHESYISILKWLSYLTDIHGFVPYFVKNGYTNTVLQWMTLKRDQTQHIPVQSWFLVIDILHNLARHWIGVKALNKLKAINILKQWKDEYISEFSSIESNENNKDILIGYYLVYAILLEPKELKKENISTIQTVLDYILERIIEAFSCPTLCFGPYNVCEYLSGLAKLVVNDKFLNYIISRDHIFDLFMEKFLLFNTIYESTDLNMIICSSLYTIFWSISFQDEYDSKLKSIEQFIQFVEQTSKIESEDEYAVMMRRAAKGILFNLDLIQMDIEPIEEIVNNNDNQTKLMISYAHKDTTFCRKLLANLQERFQGDIWVDFNKLSAPYEDDWEEIAKAITQCDVILMIVTENYCSSKSCRREVIHADKRNKRMIPIYQGKDYKPEDWFEIRLGSATWARFGDKKSDEEVMTFLFGLINVQDKVKRNNTDIVPCHELKSDSKPQINTPLITDEQTMQTPLPVKSNTIVEISDLQLPPSDFISTSPIEQWTSEEVQQWLHLPPSTLQLSSGRALMTYMNLLSHEDAQYDEYEHQMRDHGVSRALFANLISSFSSIRSLHNVEPVLIRFPEQWTRKEVKNWFRQNHLSNYLWNTLNFTDGLQLVTYAKLIVESRTRIDEEYDRLRHQIGKDRFHLDEYARLLSGLEKLINQSRLKEKSSSCVIL